MAAVLLNRDIKKKTSNAGGTEGTFCNRTREIGKL
jgi:hypothetical protein